MFKLKTQFESKEGLIINIDDDTAIKINTMDNRDMSFDIFNLLCREGHSYLFDFSQKISDIDYTEERVCTKCNESKLLLEDYRKDVNSIDGYRVVCKKCSTERDRISAKKRAEKKK